MEIDISLLDLLNFWVSNSGSNFEAKINNIVGTFFLCLIGNAAGHQSSVTGDGRLTVCLTWGLGVTFAIYLTNAASGAHLNPAITVMMALMHKIRPGKIVFVYILSQLIGAFTSSLFLDFIYGGNPS